MKRILALAALVVLVAVAGCGSSGGGSNITAASLVGTWNNATLGATGLTTVTCPGTLTSGQTTINSCSAGDHITFTANGNFTQVSSGHTSSGTYSVSGHAVTLVTTVKDGVTLGTPDTKSAVVVFTATNAFTAFPTNSTNGSFLTFIAAQAG